MNKSIQSIVEEYKNKFYCKKHSLSSSHVFKEELSGRIHTEFEQFLLSKLESVYKQGQQNCKHAAQEHRQSVYRAFSGGENDLLEQLKKGK